MADRYELISFKACPWVQRAAIVLREKGVPFECIHVEPDNRPDWFVAISPHGKVPVLRVNGRTALFESNAIAEYLDETIAPRLHPGDPIGRAINRAWTDWLPTFSGAIYAFYMTSDEAKRSEARNALRKAFATLEAALAGRSEGPWFAGSSYSLVDAGFAPFLQRWRLMEELTGNTELVAYPLLDGWSRALVERPSTHSFPAAEFEELFRSSLTRLGSWVFVRPEAKA